MKSKLSPLEQLIKDNNGKANVLNGAYGDCPNLPPGLIVEKFCPETGGTFIKLFGCSFLYKNSPSNELMAILDVAKSTLLAFLQIFNMKAIQFYLGFLFLFRKKRFNGFIKNALRLYLRITYRPMKDHLIEPIEYCKTVREINRELIATINDFIFDNNGDKELTEMLFKLKDIAMMTIEYDNAYRIRIQDVLSELDRTRMLIEPSKEINRLFDILIEREVSKHMKDKWKRIKKAVSIILFFDDTTITRFLLNLNVYEVMFDSADHYFSLMLSGYNMNGATLDQRKIMKNVIDEAKGHTIPNFKNVDDAKKKRI